MRFFIKIDDEMVEIPYSVFRAEILSAQSVSPYFFRCEFQGNRLWIMDINSNCIAYIENWGC